MWFAGKRHRKVKKINLQRLFKITKRNFKKDNYHYYIKDVKTLWSILAMVASKTDKEMQQDLVIREKEIPIGYKIN